MSQDAYDNPPSRRDGNNVIPRPSQNKSKLLEATMRNVPKLKELNYTQWKNMITNSIKNAKLWGYIDGSIGQPSEDNGGDLAIYFDEAGAVRNAMLGSLEPGAQKYIEDSFDPKDAWLALEKKYLTAESEADSRLVSIEQELANLRLEEGGDMIEHIAEFSRMRSQLSGTRFAVDDQACVSMLYRSLPPKFRQSAITHEGTEMKDLSALCARLTYLSQNPEPEASIEDKPPAVTEDYTKWGVPEDIQAFGLTGDKNPLLKDRAAVTCRDCLLKGHKAGSPECPQHEWRNELWGTESDESMLGNSDPGKLYFTNRPMLANGQRISYDFSEPVKVILDFNELGLKPKLMEYFQYFNPTLKRPLAIQQCAILPIINGHNVLAQASPSSGKSTALAISILQIIDTTLPYAQALVFTSTNQATTAFKGTLTGLGSYLSVRCYSCESSDPLPTLASLSGINNHHVFVGTPDYLLGLIHRNIINKRKLRLLVLDDIDKLIETGKKDQILEVYRHIPPLTQIVASSNVCSSSTAKAIAKLLADPLQIVAYRNEGVSIGTHFYVTIPEEQKPNVLYASYSTLGVNGIALLCRNISKITGNQWNVSHGFYYLRESMESKESEDLVKNFTSKLYEVTYSRGYSSYGRPSKQSPDPVSRVVLATNDVALSTAQLSSLGVPLINYDVPKTVEDYIKRLNQWRATQGNDQPIITFVTADTEEINVIQDLERCYGVHVLSSYAISPRVHESTNPRDLADLIATATIQTTINIQQLYHMATVEQELPLPKSESVASAATQVLDAATRNIPKLKELNYTQWKSVITHSIKTAKLWGYIDGSIKEPSEQNTNELIKYMNEAGAVRSAILGSLESGVQRHIEEALGPREAWIALEKRYLTSGDDAQLVAIEQQLADLKLEEGGDVVEHIANFCRLRRHLDDTRFALDEQSSIDMLYRSLTPNYRQLILTPERTEMKDFSVICSRLRELHQTPIADTSSDADKYLCWGVPEEIKIFGLTGEKNPLLEERAAVTCRDCLLKDHEAGTPECPQYEWRRELWGIASEKTAHHSSSDGPVVVNMKRLSYEFSEPIKVVLGFDELSLRSELKEKLRSYCSRPSAIQQCAILPIINGRNVFAQAPHNNGKTTSLLISILQRIDTSLPLVQALVLTPTEAAAASVYETFKKLRWNSGPHCFLYKSSKAVGEADLGTLIEGSQYQIVVSTPDHALGLIRRNILKMKHLKILALDDIDKLIEAGSDEQVLEVYRHTPPLAQTISSCTSLTASTWTAASKLLLDPVRILVNRDEGILMRAPHFFVKVPEDQKSAVLQATFTSLSVKKILIICRDIDRIAGNSWSGGFYYMRDSMKSYQCADVLRQFRGCYTDRMALVTTNGVLPNAGQLNDNVPMIIYDVPNNVEDYTKGINDWRDANPNYHNTIVTFVAADTHEMQVINDFEQRYDVRVEAYYMMESGTESSSPALLRNESSVRATTQVLEAVTRNIPKLKEQNYTQWKSAITHSIKAAKLWGYVDGSIEEPSEENTSELIKYMSEASAVRSAILGSLEPGAQRHIEDALAPREAWLALEKQYFTPGNDDQLAAIEQQLVDLRLEQDGDVVEHLVNFCRLRRRLHETRFALDEQTSIELLYQSLPHNYRQLILTPERTEMKNFSALCARLRDPDLCKAPETAIPMPSPAEDYTAWGVPRDIKLFGLTGDKNPLLEERAAVTCRDCLLKDHESGTQECPQYQWRKELWGAVPNSASSAPGETEHESPLPINTKRFKYEFSEPVKVALDFDELGLQHNLRGNLRTLCPKPSAIQQCAILPIIGGRDVLAQAPRGNGKTTALAISTLQIIDPLPHVQALVFTPTDQTTAAFQEVLSKLGSNLEGLCYSYDPSHIRQSDFDTLVGLNRHRIVAGTPSYLLGLINRKALKTHNLKLLVLDDIDKLIETGAEEQILEMYRQIPPLAQIVASCTILSPSIANTALKFLVDPLRIAVAQDEGVSMSARGFFAKISAGSKLTALHALISKIGSRKVAVICRALNQVPVRDSQRNIYQLDETTGWSARSNRIEDFKRYSRHILLTTQAVFPLTELSSQKALLIVYDVPAQSDIEGFSKLIRDWRETHSGKDDSIITFVTDNTDEINVIKDLDRHYGIEMTELLWDGKTLH